MKKLILLCISIFSLTYSFAQSTMSASADFVENETKLVEWTIGEPFVETLSDGTTILTQGVNQSNPQNSSVEVINIENSFVKLYPNPTTDYIIVDISTDIEDKTKTITDILGNVIIQTDETTISVSELASGVYFLSLNIDRDVKQTFSFIKQ